MLYDYVIVGGGPTALACATYLPGTKIILEKRDSWGGCHKVQRDREGLFCEHGPRVYSESFVNTRRFLESHGIEWSEAFRPVQYAPDHIDGARWYQWMSWRALVGLTLATITYMLFIPQGESVSTFLDKWNVVDPKERRLFDTVCRFSDGAGSDAYRVDQFVAGFDFHSLGRFYVPKRSLDTSVWNRVTESLHTRFGTTLRSHTHVRTVLVHRGRAVGVRTRDGATFLAGTAVLLCVPPKPMASILRASGLVDFRDVAERTAYISYDSYALHFHRGNYPLLKPESGFIDTPWGLIYIDLGHIERGTMTRVLSVAITRVHDPSPRTKISARQSSSDEVVAEIVRQLPLTRQARDNLMQVVPTPEGEHAYMHTPGTDVTIPSVHPQVQGLAMVGIVNGTSRYPFTSIESAVQSAMRFCHVRPHMPWTIRQVMVMLVITLGVLGILGMVIRKK